MYVQSDMTVRGTCRMDKGGGWMIKEKGEGGGEKLTVKTQVKKPEKIYSYYSQTTSQRNIEFYGWLLPTGEGDPVVPLRFYQG